MEIQVIRREVLAMLHERLEGDELVYVTSAELAEAHDTLSVKQVAQGMTAIRDQPDRQEITVSAWGKTAGTQWMVERDG